MLVRQGNGTDVFLILRLAKSMDFLFAFHVAPVMNYSNSDMLLCGVEITE